MKTMQNERRQAWRSMSSQDKHQRLQAMRQQQQRQVEFEMLRLQSARAMSLRLPSSAPGPGRHPNRGLCTTIRMTVPGRCAISGQVVAARTRSAIWVSHSR